ncbi:uncharacterized protein LOC133501081 [Syngnathoides biaculeatus]|uniref:uncharacterized protein LOC133501081 n=1 Tax=Syngnathoides biaculeatus TaxID=300417 RepID=UPI002ADE7793|nr:uncharacterized protein LOC133501081 [Syngnathoides biaculeatus]
MNSVSSLGSCILSHTPENPNVEQVASCQIMLNRTLSRPIGTEMWSPRAGRRDVIISCDRAFSLPALRPLSHVRFKWSWPLSDLSNRAQILLRALVYAAPHPSPLLSTPRIPPLDHLCDISHPCWLSILKLAMPEDGSDYCSPLFLHSFPPSLDPFFHPPNRPSHRQQSIACDSMGAVDLRRSRCKQPQTAIVHSAAEKCCYL